MTGQRALNFKYTDLGISLKAGQNPFQNFIFMTDYETSL
jgi:hypothetical protein